LPAGIGGFLFPSRFEELIGFVSLCFIKVELFMVELF